MSRLELGRVAFKERDVSDLLVFYGVTTPAARRRALPRRGGQPPGVVARVRGRHARLVPELRWPRGGRDALRTYETHFVPGLLQTPDYARAVLASTIPPLSGHAISSVRSSCG